jgi:hypothetical protein
MRRHVPFGWAILVLSLATIAWIYFKYLPSEGAKLQQVEGLKCPSDIQLRMTLNFDDPPVLTEEYLMHDVDGVSTSSYRIRGYAGKQITVTAPPSATYDVPFLFGQVVQDGIWDLVDQPPHGKTGIHYTLYVRQTALITVTDPKTGDTSTQCKTGDRTITFTDPHWLATTAGRQYQINLSGGAPKGPNDLLKMRSTELANPHYQMVVDDFRKFGPDSFRSKVAAARATIEKTK